MKWLQNTLPKTIEIDLNLDPKVPHIRADANQLNQVMLNLCVNARDAMADKGNLRLSTGIVPGNKLQNRFPGIDDQDYVCIAVGDTGAGMDKQVREHIFEPFFTTKEQQKGTRARAVDRLWNYYKASRFHRRRYSSRRWDYFSYLSAGNVVI